MSLSLTVVSPDIIQLIGGEEKWKRLCLKYKKYQLEHSRKPSLIDLFKRNKIARSTYNNIVALTGGADGLHDLIAQASSSELDLLQSAFKDVLQESISQMPQYKPKERNELLKLLADMGGLLKDHKPDVQVNNNTFNVDDYLANRIIDGEVE